MLIRTILLTFFCTILHHQRRWNLIQALIIIIKSYRHNYKIVVYNCNVELCEIHLYTISCMSIISTAKNVYMLEQLIFPGMSLQNRRLFQIILNSIVYIT